MRVTISRMRGSRKSARKPLCAAKKERLLRGSAGARLRPPDAGAAGGALGTGARGRRVQGAEVTTAPDEVVPAQLGL